MWRGKEGGEEEEGGKKKKKKRWRKRERVGDEERVREREREGREGGVLRGEGGCKGMRKMEKIDRE